MLSAAILLLASPVAAFTLASAPLTPCAGGAAISGFCAVRMQDDAPEKVGTDSPLASFASADAMSQKEEANAKREALRSRINIFLPLTFVTCFGIASFIGEDKVKGSLAGMGDPLSSAPGVTEAREAKKKRGAKVRSENRLSAQESHLHNRFPARCCSWPISALHLHLRVLVRVVQAKKEQTEAIAEFMGK